MGEDEVAEEERATETGTRASNVEASLLSGFFHCSVPRCGWIPRVLLLEAIELFSTSDMCPSKEPLVSATHDKKPWLLWRSMLPRTSSA